MSSKHVAVAYFGGQVFTRQTDKQYQFLVVAGLPDRARLEASMLAKVEDAERRNWQYWTDMSKGVVQPAHEHDVTLMIEKITLGLDGAIAKRRKEVRAWIERQAQDNAFDRYVERGWCSSRDLAIKVAARIMREDQLQADVQIVPVNN